MMPQPAGVHKGRVSPPGWRTGGPKVTLWGKRRGRPLATEPHPSRRHRNMPTVRATVLVIDDEPVIREFVTSSLGQQGYSVLAAGSGGEALQLAISRSSELGLALIELRLPDWDAETLSRMLRRVRPSLPCGYVTWAGGGAAAPLLRKPFSHSELVAFVDGLLTVEAESARFDGANPAGERPHAQTLSRAGRP
jgi:DNA-binding response OmpR family regulator